MRKRFTNNNGVTVNAVAGTYVVLLGMNATEQARKGLLGFAIWRNDITENQQYWLAGFKTFKDTLPSPKPGTLVSTEQHPVQGFLWGDYTAKPNHQYSYKVVPVYGTPANLIYGDPVIADVSTENEDLGKHAIYFNRGVAGSQAYVRKFGDKKPKDAGPAAYQWLSRGAEEAILKYIGQANSAEYSLRAAVYEFSWMPVLQAFQSARKSGADVKIVYDCRKAEPHTTSDACITKAGIGDLMIPRKANPSYIAHNKFIVLLKNNKPVKVLSGSTNFTEGGIFGQSNVVHVISDPDIAAQYLAYWELLAVDTDAKVLRPLNVTQTPDPVQASAGISPIFSPRTSLNVLNWYSEQMDKAAKSSGFTAAFGVNKTIAAVLGSNKVNFRYVMLEKTGDTYDQFSANPNNYISIGAVLGSAAVGDLDFQQWVKESLSNLNENVNYLHTKYLFIDPLSDNPLVISGSANFSNASTINNDENMLLIKGDTVVADIYLGEFMRLWNHFYFRDIANKYASKATAGAAYLSPDDTWTEKYYGGAFQKTTERELFA
ncbi:phospholipase D-like domain-containing protein [Mucilaginibacter sp.]|jgi:phosphatidylserine/phosphatidylglycerophosphate/cardiolipin synthase-like enzyme|uniref:phospholipase D-like domain-containing protein n=1 Tax=Mucilaginibacter sp. TaxID=1882438 RepID=UPI0035650B9D